MPPDKLLPHILDMKRNYGNFDFKNNMALILALPNHHKSQPLNPPEAGYVRWQYLSKSNSAEFYSSFGHVVGVRRHKNSFVVIDGMTGEELLVHPMTIEEGKQWRRKAEQDGWYRGNDYDNLLEWSCDFFSIPKEKFCEIDEKVQQHDTSNETFVGSGWSYRDGKYELTGQ